MNDSSLSDPPDQPPVVLAPRELRTYIVDLPDKDLLSCNELAFVIADALVGHIETMPPSSATRTTWADSIAPNLLYPRSHAARQLVKQRRQERGEAAPDRANPPLISPERERWLDACAQRLQDLQAWVVREDLQIFTAARTKAQSIAPGTYLRRADAARYCLESGFELKSRAIADSQTSQCDPMASAAAEPSTDSGTKVVAPPATPARPPMKPSARLLRTKEAILRTGLSRSSFYERQNPKSRYFDATFPNPVQIGQSAMGYREDELDAWIASRPQKAR